MPKSRKNRKSRGRGPGGNPNRGQPIKKNFRPDNTALWEAAIHYNRGNAKLEKGDYEGAIAGYDHAIVIAPNDSEAFCNRGIAKYNTDDYDGAIADYDRAIAIDPNLAIAYTQRGNAKDESGNPHGAIEDHDRAIALAPDSADAYYNRGHTKNRMGDYEGAIADFDKTIDLEPDSPDAYGMRGLSKYRKGDYDDAIGDYDHAITLDPNSAQVYHNRGLAKSAKGNYKEAIADYDRSIALEAEDDARDYYGRGIAKANQGDYFGALADFDRVIAIDPHFEEARHNRGVCKLNWGIIGDIEGAIEDFDRSYHPDPKPDYALRYYNRAVFFASASLNTDSFEALIAEMEIKAFSRDGLDEMVSTILGACDRVIADFGRAIELNPDFASAYSGRGGAWAWAGEHQQAIADFDRAIELNPEDAQAYYGRGMVKAKQKDYDAALADLNQADTCDDDVLRDPEERRLFYDAKESIARAAERARSQFEMAQLLGASEEEKEEQKRRAEVAESERYQLLAQIKQLTKALHTRERMPEDTPIHLDTTRVQYYSDSQGRTPYIDWLTEDLGRTSQRRVREAITQMQKGNFGDSKPLHAHGLFERRLDSGLRIYYTRLSQDSILILGGGDKPDQQSDIAIAEERLADWHARHPK